MDLPSPELVFPLLMDAFARRGRGVADLIALSGKKGNPPRPHPLPICVPRRQIPRSPHPAPSLQVFVQVNDARLEYGSFI
ncbi:unnamed protein product [Miscanthus lutarioriparius]|uniref:Uncharacterized protein n=1 Tax=Miscanthus lutarioriparius TaxID=422564 RepID=A0A811PBZ7_9POAL|nr:unnamed protein product [Miscanthus lutarioriparius]